MSTKRLYCGKSVKNKLAKQSHLKVGYKNDAT